MESFTASVLERVLQVNGASINSQEPKFDYLERNHLNALKCKYF